MAEPPPNNFDREATEVVQLYLHQRYGAASRPVRELKGFQRVILPAQTSREVQFVLGSEARRFPSRGRRFGHFEGGGQVSL